MCDIHRQVQYYEEREREREREIEREREYHTSSTTL